MKLGEYKIGIFFLGLVLASCSLWKNHEKKKGLWGRLQRFQDLKKESLGKDYLITVKKKKMAPLVLGIHGGKIEVGTSELAREIEKQGQTSLYLFEGVKAPDYFSDIGQSGYLHLTSHKFNDPRLISLAKESSFCLSLHGYHKKEPHICLGGGASLSLKEELLRKLEKEFPLMSFCLDCCPPYLGKNPQNPVNLCENKGIQLEMAPKTRFKILKDMSFRQRLGSLLSNFLRKRFP